VIYYKYVDIEAAAAKPKISFLSNVPLRGGGGGNASTLFSFAVTRANIITNVFV